MQPSRSLLRAASACLANPHGHVSTARLAARLLWASIPRAEGFHSALRDDHTRSPPPTRYMSSPFKMLRPRRASRGAAYGRGEEWETQERDDQEPEQEEQAPRRRSRCRAGAWKPPLQTPERPAVLAMGQAARLERPRRAANANAGCCIFPPHAPALAPAAPSTCLPRPLSVCSTRGGGRRL